MQKNNNNKSLHLLCICRSKQINFIVSRKFVKVLYYNIARIQNLDFGVNVYKFIAPFENCLKIFA